MLELLRTTFGFLIFCSSSDSLRAMKIRHLSVALVCILFAGMFQPWGQFDIGLDTDFGLAYLIRTVLLTIAIVYFGAPFFEEEYRFIPMLTCVGMSSLPTILFGLPFDRMAGSESMEFTIYIVTLWRFFLFWSLLILVGRSEPLGAAVVSFMATYVVICSWGIWSGESWFSIEGPISPYEPFFRKGIIATLLWFVFVPMFLIAYSAAVVAKILNSRKSS